LTTWIALIFCAIPTRGAGRFVEGTGFDLAGSFDGFFLGLVRGSTTPFTPLLGFGQGRLWRNANRGDDIRWRRGLRKPLAPGPLCLCCRFLSADETAEPVKYSPDEPGNLAGFIACHHSGSPRKSIAWYG
jgi:hypothetical protein